MRFSYKVKGKPSLFTDDQQFLQVSSETGQISKAEQPVSDTTRRIARLRTFDTAGNDDEVLFEASFSRGPFKPDWTLRVNRGRFFRIIERISDNDGLVRDIIDNWHRETLNYLKGSSEPLDSNCIDQELFQFLCDPENVDEAAAILAMLRNEIESQIVALHATAEDLRDLEPVIREIRIVRAKD